MSSKEWKKVKLSEIAYLNYGKSLTSDIRKEGKIPVYSSSGTTGWHDTALVNEDGIVIGRKGNVGSIFYADGPFYCIDTAYYIKKSELKCNIKYFYYLLKTLGLDKLNEDSAVPGLNRDTAHSQLFSYPEEIDTQRRIADILSVLDDKIELNRQTNVTLEAIAQAIFKEWFINFNFPGGTGEVVESELGMIPKGWKILPLDKIAEFLNGLALQNYPAKNDCNYLPVIKIREMKNGITNSSDKASKNLPSKYIIHDGDLLFSWSGSLEIIFWVGGDGALNQHLFKVTSRDYPLWFCYFWILQYIDKFRGIAEDKTTTMGHIQRHHISEALCLIPDRGLEQSND